jgi:hypothetical protein
MDNFSINIILLMLSYLVTFDYSMLFFAIIKYFSLNYLKIL